MIEIWIQTKSNENYILREICLQKMSFKLLKSDALVFQSCGNSEKIDTACANKNRIRDIKCSKTRSRSFANECILNTIVLFIIICCDI
jgi:hypothetical protein